VIRRPGFVGFGSELGQKRCHRCLAHCQGRFRTQAGTIIADRAGRAKCIDTLSLLQRLAVRLTG